MSCIVVVCSEFNKKLVEEKYHQAETEFKKHSQFFSSYYPQSELKQIWVPGAGEIPLTVKWIIDQKDISSNSLLKTQLTKNKSRLKKLENIDLEKISLKTQLTKNKSIPSNIIGVLALGVIIKGQTGHYDFLNGFLQKALWDLQKTCSFPILFSILLLENREQAPARITRAKEAMKALVKMIQLKQKLY